MEPITDNIPIESAGPQVAFATFWYRFGAGIIDAAVFVIIYFPLKMFYGTEWKYSISSLVMDIFSVGYKPFMEYRYGATIGKMLLDLKVVDGNYAKANLFQVLMRNVFGLIQSLVFIIISLIIINNPQIKEIVSSPNHHSNITFSNFPFILKFEIFFGLFSFALIVVDALFLVNDNKARALHDRIGKTYVIINKEAGKE